MIVSLGKHREGTNLGISQSHLHALRAVCAVRAKVTALLSYAVCALYGTTTTVLIVVSCRLRRGFCFSNY